MGEAGMPPAIFMLPEPMGGLRQGMHRSLTDRAVITVGTSPIQAMEFMAPCRPIRVEAITMMATGNPDKAMATGNQVKAMATDSLVRVWAMTTSSQGRAMAMEAGLKDQTWVMETMVRRIPTLIGMGRPHHDGVSENKMSHANKRRQGLKPCLLHDKVFLSWGLAPCDVYDGCCIINFQRHSR